MMGNKKLSEIKAEVVALLNRLSGGSPKKWLNREIQMAKKNPNRDEQALRMLLAALESEARKVSRANKRPAVRKR
jgi:hypothetical protein